MGEPLTVRAVAELVGGRAEGDETVVVRSMAALESAGEGEITFATDEKRAARLSKCRASAAIVGADAAVSADMPLIRAANVQAAVAKLLGHWARQPARPAVGVHPSAVVAEDARVDDTAAIGPWVSIAPGASVGPGSVLHERVSIGRGAKVGANCVLAAGAVVCHDCRLGDRVIVGPNSVIGWDGFGYYYADGRHNKVPHGGNVVIEDDVEIGASSCVDRAKFGSTRIGAGTKIDNLVQVAHNVQIGRNCILAAQAGIAGSATLGDDVIIMGHAGIRDNIRIGSGAKCAAFCAVASDVADGQAVAGIPARPARDALRIIQALPKLTDLLKRVRELESRIKSIASSDDD